MVAVEVGKVFPLDEKLKKLLGGDGGALDYDKESKTLHLFVTLEKPTAKERQAFRNGLLRFGLYRNQLLNTAVIMVYMGTDLVFDLTYDINILDADMDGVIEGNRFNMYLLDSKTGVVHGLRTIGMGENFMKELNRICRNDGRYTSAQFQEWMKNDVDQKWLEELWRDSEKIDWDK